jgi:hypothetical protein
MSMQDLQHWQGALMLHGNCTIWQFWYETNAHP